MRIIHDDAPGLAVLLDVARKVSELLVNHNVALGVGYNDGEEHPVAVITANANGYRIGVTIEPRARIVDLAGDDTTPEPEPEVIATRRAGAPHRGLTANHYDRLGDSEAHCLCVASCCSDGRGQCVCLTCENSSHDHG